jgi:tripartite ATP-independent transporter DctM subunit
MGGFSIRAVFRSGWRALLAFGMPVIILGGLVFGIFTPTEAGAFAVAYALLLAGPLYRRLNLRALYRVVVQAAMMTGEVMLIVGLSTALGWALSNARVPMALAEAIDFIVIYDSDTLRIIAMVVLAILAGMILDPLIPVIMPILLPTLILYDIDLIHFGVLMVISVVIGQVTPPVAIALVVASKIAKEDLALVLRANTPFLLGMALFLMVIILVPELATWLPEALKK